MTASKQPKGESEKVVEKKMKPITALRLQRMIGLVIALFLLLAAVFLSLMVGAKPLSFSVVWEALFSSANSYDYTIIHESRIPRTIIALAVGPAFGLAGAVIQALTRNPLADPGILGVNAGAAFAVALAVGVFSITSITSYIWFALVGAFVATIAIYFIGGGAGKKSPSPEQIVLAGVAMAAALNGITTALSLINSRAFAGMLNWRIGSIARKGLEDLWPILPFLVIGLIVALAIAPALNAIAFGDDRASSLGVNVNRMRILGLIAVTLLAGGATAIAGPIVFIGLMVPHCVRWFVGPDQPWIFLYSVVVAPLILLLSDIIGRVVMSPAEVPVGIITGFVGAPILLILVRRRKASSL
ncbi:FecCD family ABC transporter permease [Robertmurraya andreesenii]|uniref:Iron complex transport system permease protein n=1 Tax=Anoxybacillus andreesenii TaxID=1325932 RepID=A0ABT9V314_9BACL|nr:iron chelate uptake ABC transporter family permease subunit [Robertmurraya andreesenii]MDQ0155343.1 iron complex transport system permease protein [Robertmurraya andreesenii]